VRVSVSDACIFLDLFDLELIDSFFSLDLEIHSSSEVVGELFDYQRRRLKEYQIKKMILIHSLDKDDWDAISRKGYPNTISYNDKIALYLSDKLDCLLLGSDKIVRQIAKKKSIQYHGILWIFDQLIENEKISKTEAITKLGKLSKSIKVYQQNSELINGMQSRINSWKALSLVS
jgi:predicted nucleic acid-binding protein